MPTPKKGAHLGGSPAHQRLIIANLCKELIKHKSITTTQAKAKTVQPYMEKLITKAKRGDTAARREALKVLNDRESAYVLFEELAPLFAERNGGYTRIVKIGNRKGDNAPMAVISLVTEKLSPKQSAVKEAENAAKAAAAATTEPEASSSDEAEDTAAEAAEEESAVEAAEETVEEK